MKKAICSLILVVVVITPSFGRPQELFQALQRYNGNVAYAYNDGNSSRTENVNADGTISGSYSLLQDDGTVRTVHYSAGKNGVKFSGDIGVDDNTAEAAARLKDLLPTSPTNPPGYNKQAPAPTNPPDYYRQEPAQTNPPDYYRQAPAPTNSPHHNAPAQPIAQEYNPNNLRIIYQKDLNKYVYYDDVHGTFHLPSRRINA